MEVDHAALEALEDDVPAVLGDRRGRTRCRAGNPGPGRHGHARVPMAAVNHDTEQARESIRKIAALEPAAAWPGHADPVTGDVRAQLEQAAADSGRRLVLREFRGQPLDHPEVVTIPETGYLKGALLEALD